MKACDRFFKMAAYEVVYTTKVSVNIMIIVIITIINIIIIVIIVISTTTRLLTLINWNEIKWFTCKVEICIEK